MGLSAPPLPVIVDASFVIDGLGGDDRVHAAFEAWAQEGRTVLAPAIFWPEIANALLVRRRHSRSDVVAALRTLQLAGVETADRGVRGVEDAVDLAAQHGLSVYDATYLQLAMDVEGEIATRDRQLMAAAAAEDVLLFEPPTG